MRPNPSMGRQDDFRHRLRPELQLDRLERLDGARLPALKYEAGQGL